MDDDMEQVQFGRYECDQCGACCKGTFIVEADYLDVRREPRVIELQVGNGNIAAAVDADFDHLAAIDQRSPGT